MASAVEVRALAPEDDRSRFTCGHPELDRFFRDYAGQNQFKLHLSVTYVAVLAGKIVGFATVTVGSLERASLPPAVAKKRLPAYPLPVLRLARLGVDATAQGKGIGQALLLHVFSLALAQRDQLGCVGLVTDAKPDAVGFYERLGFRALRTTEGALHGSTTPLFLPIDTLEASSPS